MFELKSKTEIGDYLRNLIEQKFGTPSEFCRAYIEVSGSQNDETKFTNLKNRISSIVNGKKDIQLYDFPVFTKLLNVSCEEILSAGEAKTITANHLTNYQIASSHDKNLWEVCINSEDSIFLNPDEYNKTILDYIFEFNNYDFLKYLMDKNFIWFVSKTSEKDCWLGFGAGTSVKRRTLCDDYSLEQRLKYDDSLRRKMIVLAIEKSDIKMLDELRAREIPPMYILRPTGNISTDFEKFYDLEMVEALSKADEAVLNYFSKEVTVVTSFRNTQQKLMFPAIGILLEKLIKNKNKCTEAILRRCIEHNKKTYDFVKEIVERQKDYYNRCYFDYYEDGNIISVLDSQSKNSDVAKDGIVTNIIRVNIQSNSFVVSELINVLNKYFDDILALDPEKGDKYVL